MIKENENIHLKISGAPELDGTHEAVIMTSHPRVFELFGKQDAPRCQVKLTLKQRNCGCILAGIKYSVENRICVDRCKLNMLNGRDGDEVLIEKIQFPEARHATLSVPFGVNDQEIKRLFDKPLVKGEKTLLFTLSGQAQIIHVDHLKPEMASIHDKTELVINKVNELNGVPIRYEDIGGLQREVHQIRQTVEWPLKYPEQFSRLGVPHPKGIILYGPPGTGKTMIAKALAAEVGAKVFSISGPEIYGKYYGESEARLRNLFEQAQANAPAVIVIDELDALAPSRKSEGEGERRVVATLLTQMDGMKALKGVIVIGTTNRINSIDSALRREGRFAVEINVGTPDIAGRRKILEIHTRQMPLAEDVNLDTLATRTVGFVGADIVTLCREAAFCAVRRSVSKSQFDLSGMKNPKITQEHFLEALKNVKPSAMREFLVEIPDTSWEDIGGLEDVKKLLIENITYAITRSEAYRKAGVRPARGILLYGKPGTGKTLLAKAAARQSGANFVAIRGPEIRSKWFGESEERLREIFQKAREASPCIIFFDEIDAVAPARGNSNPTDSIVNQLLAEIDGIQSSDGIIVVGATNRHKVLDPAMLRPGRFDYQIEVPMPDREARRRILQIHLAGKPIIEQVDIEKLLEITEDFSGAELSEMCRQAGMTALRRAAFKADGVEITNKDLRAAAENVRKTTEDMKPRPFGFGRQK
jgi:transitional endoplasmic reticulum ATPase